MLQRLKRELAGYTVTSGVTYSVLGAKVGETDCFISTMMRTEFRNLVSRTQLWAAVFDLRVNFKLFIEEESAPTPEMEMMEKLAAPFANHKWQRLLLNERLLDVRKNLGLSDVDYGLRMGVGAEAARMTEDSHDWLMPNLFRRVRALGGTLELSLS